MCLKCGCGKKAGKTTEHVHHREDGTPYVHSHDGAGKKHVHDKEKSRTVMIRKNILAGNDKIAEANRKLISGHGAIAINIISSPGSGKTSLLERTLDMLNGKTKCAVIVGDQLGELDAKRLEGRGAQVIQIQTGDSCHLNAKQISSVLHEVLHLGTELLFIENVGNLVCPAAFDLGENVKIALLSTPEGEDKPLKYPSVFTGVQAVVITKTDLIPHLDWNLERCRKFIRKVNPGAEIIEVSSKTGDGFKKFISYLARIA